MSLREVCVRTVEYLGHLLSNKGIAKGEKVDAVKNMPAPTNVSSLRSFLGSVQFYGKFLPNLSTVSEPHLQGKTPNGFGVKQNKLLLRRTKKYFVWTQS